MKIGVTKFIPENIKPPNVYKLAIYDGNTKICDVDISSMIPKNLGTKLYSFGLLSDIHLRGDYDDYPMGDILDNAMTFFENQGCSFCCNAGDLTMYGYFTNVTIEEDLSQMAEYRTICAKHPNLPMYGICGNHESFNKSLYDETNPKYEQMKIDTGHDLYYTIAQGNDLFVMIGQPSTSYYGQGKSEIWDEELEWLDATLAANTNKRCFVFIHSCLTDDSGNPKGIHDETIGAQETAFVSVMKKYPNAILFHGHSHLDFCEQFKYSYLNYSTKKGIKSIHIPSIYASRLVKEDESGFEASDRSRKYGYIAEAYENHLVLRGYDFLANEFVPIAQYCIET